MPYKCIYDGCDKLALYNLKNLKPIYCSIHKNVDMVDVLHKKCNYNGCNQSPLFGLTNGQPEFCKTHKK